MDGVRGGIAVVLMAVGRGVAEAPNLLMACMWSQDVIKALVMFLLD